MSSTVDYYQLLHVNEDAPQAIIRASYRVIMQALRGHPDLGGDAEQASLINEAYAVLSRPESRSAYDRARRSRRAAERSAVKRAVGYRTAAGGWFDQCPFCGQHCESAAHHDEPPDCTCCGSPLIPVASDETPPVGERSEDRLPRSLMVTLYRRWPDAVGELVTTEDISLKGLRLRLEEPLLEGQVLKLSCGLFEATARVVYQRGLEGAYQVGVRFLTLRRLKPRGGFLTVTA